MQTALIGYTGFVGSVLLKQSQLPLSGLYRSTNIHEIAGQSFDQIICAGAPAVKWKANREPEEDWKNLQLLMNNLQQARAESLILISTVDVYRDPRGADEDTPIIAGELEPYGKHRFLLEEFARKQFKNTYVLRLPGLFGPGLKKNAIFDLLNGNALHLIHRDSSFQFYNLNRLSRDIETTIQNRLPLVNLATAPVSVADVALKCFDLDFDNRTDRPPIHYDMHTRHAPLFGGVNPYVSSADETFDGIRAFVRAERNRQ